MTKFEYIYLIYNKELYIWKNWTMRTMKRVCSVDLMKNDLYIRLGDLPKNEQSKNHLTNTFENGVSCFKQYHTVVGNTIEIPNLSDSTFLTLAECYMRPIYLIKGNEVGIGSDDEPLLKEVSIIKQLNYNIDVLGITRLN